MSNVKNYSAQGGEKWVVKGELELTEGGRLLFYGKELKPLVGPADSEADTIAKLKADYNLLLARLYATGIVWADKVDLEDTILAALELLEDALVGEEPGQYPEGVYSAFVAAVETAQEVAAETGITQSQVDAAVAALAAALATFSEGVVSD